MPPAKAFASVTVLLAAALLWLTVVLLMVADPWTRMPPPCASPQTALLESSTVLPLTALAAIVSLPSEVMPPPSALHPCGADVIERLRLTTVLVSVRFRQFWIPAPPASLATGPPA